MERQNRSFFQRLITAAVSAGMLASLAACAKPPAEAAAPKEPVTAEKAIIQLQEQSAALGFDNALEELEEKNTSTIGGDTYIRLQQYYEGIPVYGKTIVYAANEDGQMTSVTGNVQDIQGDIDLKPTVTKEEVQSSLSAYAKEKLGYASVDSVSLSFFDENLCIFVNDHEDGAALAYSVIASVTESGMSYPYEIVFDAHTGQILSCYSSVYTDWVPMTLEGPGGIDMLVDITEEQDEDGKTYYTMHDDRRNIHIISANNATLQFELYNYDDELVRDRDGNILKNEDTLDVYPIWISAKGVTEPISYSDPPRFEPEAVKLLSNLQTAYDYYEDVFGVSGFTVSSGRAQIYACYNDHLSGDTTNAYCWGYAGVPMYSMLFSFGSDNSLSLDTVAHEYTHAIERKRSCMKYEGESGAIMEALSDLYGELVESWATKTDPDWNHAGHRNIKDPSKSQLPESYGGVHWVNPDNTENDHGGVHYNNTVISHAAYLMWRGTDGNGSARLTTEELATLWYRAMLMMPSDCDFILCRQLVEVAAQSMEDLTDEQRACVREAFDRVGIASSRGDDFHADYVLAEDATLTVYDQNNEPYSGYTLRISGSIDMKEIASNMTPDIGWVVNRTVTVEEAGAYALDLPQGRYTLTITDPHYEEVYTIYVAVSDEYTETNIDLITAYEEPLVVVIPTTTEVISEFTYKADGTLSSITHHDYNEEGLLQSSTSWSLSDDGHYAYWYTDSTTSFQYDPAGNPIQTIIFSNNHDVTTNSEYDDSGNLLLTHNLQSGIKREYRYDDAGNLTWVCGKDADGNILDAAEYFYDANGNQIRSVDYWYSSGEIVYADVYVSEYDDQGHLISTKSEESDDDWTVYTYDANWNLIRKESRYGDMAFNMTYEYDEQNRLVYTEETDSWESRSGTTYEYDSSGNIVSKTFLDGSKIVYVYDRITASEPIGGWKDAYRSYIRNLDNIPDETRFYLADMNSDGIPELFIDFVIYADGAILCTFDGTSVISEHLSSGRISFIPGTGSFHHYWSFQGMYSDTIYRIENGSFETVAVGFWTDMEPDSHTWNDEPVTPEAYTQNLTDAFDDSAAVPMGHLPADMTIDSVVGPNEYSFAQILSILS